MVRLRFRALSALAPRLAEREAASLFLTPRRRRVYAEPRVAHSPRQELSVDDGEFRLAGWSWGTGPTVLLVHGWQGTAADMEALAGAISRAGFRAVAFDMPAHGRSPGRRTSLAEWIRALLAIQRQLEPIDAVVGHSFGGAAVTLAIEAGVNARSAVLIAPALAPGYFIERVRRFIGLPEERTAGMVARLSEIVGNDISHFDASRAAASLSVPALVMHDPADTEVPWAHAEGIARAWSGAELVARPGCGHYRILSDPWTLDRTASFVVSTLAPLARQA